MARPCVRTDLGLRPAHQFCRRQDGSESRLSEVPDGERVWIAHPTRGFFEVTVTRRCEHSWMTFIAFEPGGLTPAKKYRRCVRCKHRVNIAISPEEVERWTKAVKTLDDEDVEPTSDFYSSAPTLPPPPPA